MGALGGPLEIRNKVLFQESEKMIISKDIVQQMSFLLKLNDSER